MIAEEGPIISYTHKPLFILEFLKLKECLIKLDREISSVGFCFLLLQRLFTEHGEISQLFLHNN